MPEPAPPAACVVLVPVGGAIDAGCDDALRALEYAGYPVWRVRGYSAVDAARNQMATDALAAGFDEFMWVDSDVAFDPADVGRLRAHGLPFTCGLYPKKGPRQFACEFLPDTAAVRFGRGGGLVEVRYCGFGFTHVRRPVFDAVRQHADLPECNQRFGRPLVPYFEPLSVPEPGGRWALSEDYAFCERARRAGFAPVADSRVRLWHVGNYRYGWEDAGSAKERYADYLFRLPGRQSGEPAAAVNTAPVETQDWHAAHAPLLDPVLAAVKSQPAHALEVGGSGNESTVWLLDHVLTHPDATLTRVGPAASPLSHDKLRVHVGSSADALRAMTGERFDLVYLGGSRAAADVLTAAVLAWPLLKPGGLLAFADYGWLGFPEPERCPALGADAFLAAMRGRFAEAHRGYQLWVRKPPG